MGEKEYNKNTFSEKINYFFMNLWFNLKDFQFRKFFYLFIANVLIWWLATSIPFNFYIIYCLVFLVTGFCVKPIFKETKHYFYEILTLSIIKTVCRTPFEQPYIPNDFFINILFLIITISLIYAGIYISNIFGQFVIKMKNREI